MVEIAVVDTEVRNVSYDLIAPGLIFEVPLQFIDASIICSQYFSFYTLYNNY